MRRKFVGALSIVALLLFVYLQTACNKGIDSPTAPNDPAPPTTSTTTPTPITNVPNAQPTAQPSTPPSDAQFDGSFDNRDGSATVTNNPGRIGSTTVSQCVYRVLDGVDFRNGQSSLVTQRQMTVADGATALFPALDTGELCDGLYQCDASNIPTCPLSHTGLTSYIMPATGFVTVRNKPCVTCETMQISLKYKKIAEDDTSITYEFSSNVPGVFTPATGKYTKGDTAREEIVGFVSTEKGCPSSMPVPVPAKKEKPNCSAKNLKLTASPAVDKKNTSPTYRFCFAGSWTNPGTGTFQGNINVPPPVSVGNPFTNLCYDYPQGDTKKTFASMLRVDDGEQQCSFQLDVEVPGREQTCEDFPAPVTTCTPNVTQTSSSVTLNSIACTPLAVTWSCALPSAPHARPAYGQPPASPIECDGTYGYNPIEGLSCSASKHVSVPVPPQEPTCDDLNPKYSEYTGNGEVVPYSNGPTYWKMNQGNDNARKNACEGRGGTWLNTYNVPGLGVRDDVCRFPEGNPPGNPGSDMTFLAGGAVGVKASTSLTLAYGQYTAKLMASTCALKPAGNSGYSGPITLEDPLPGAMSTSTSCQTWAKDTKSYNVACGAAQTFTSLGYTCSNCHQDTMYWWIEIDPAGAGFPTKSFGYLPRIGF